MRLCVKSLTHSWKFTHYYSTVLPLNRLNYHTMSYKCVSCRFEILKCEEFYWDTKYFMSVLLSYIVDNIDIDGIIFSFDVIPYASVHQRVFM